MDSRKNFYDPRTDTWERGPSLHQGANGTRSGRRSPLASVEVLDTAARVPGQDLPPLGKHIRGEASWIVASPEG